MRPVSQEFHLAASHAHVMTVRATSRLGGRVLATDIPVAGGDVTADAGALVRRTLTMTIPGEQWAPRYSDDPLAPYGQELTVERGIRYATGITEWCTLGVFRIESVAVDLLAGEVTLTGSDRMAGLAESVFGVPFSPYAKGPQVVDAMRHLIRRIVADAVFEDRIADPRNASKSALYDDGGDYATTLADLAAGLGGECYVGADGRFILDDVPTVGAPVLVVAGGDGGILVTAASQLSREDVYNGVIARGEPTDGTAPVVGYAFDLDPRSPLRWGGPFGRHPRVYASPLLATKAQAEKAARTVLASSLGASRVVDLSAVPDPSLEVGDTIAVTYPGGLVDRHVVDYLSIPLTVAGPMIARTRSTSYVLPDPSSSSAPASSSRRLVALPGGTS